MKKLAAILIALSLSVPAFAWACNCCPQESDRDATAFETLTGTWDPAPSDPNCCPQVRAHLTDCVGETIQNSTLVPAGQWVHRILLSLNRLSTLPLENLPPDLRKSTPPLVSSEPPLYLILENLRL